MRVRLFCNGNEAPITPFIGNFIGNVCTGILGSLKDAVPTRTALFELHGNLLNIAADERTIPTDKSQGFATVIVRHTLQGMLRDLKGIDLAGDIRIEVRLDEGS